MLHVLGRVIVVPLGFLLGCLATIAVLLTLGLEIFTRGLAVGDAGQEKIEVVLDLGLGLFNVLAAATIVPALLVVIVGEIGRIRSVLYYVVGGGLAVALLPLLARVAPAQGGTALPLRVWTVAATAGFAGGLVYWLIAGRSA